ncbi:hypothetical protein RKD18_000086 [Streptomyces phaeoluteigriseus]
MSRAVPPAARERARARSCTNRRAAPGEKCAPDRAGRSQLHRGRIWDARRALEPMPPHRILRLDADRMYMELDPTDADTLVVSWHTDALEVLAAYSYEAAALLWLALKQAEVLRPDGPKISNFGLALILVPLDFLTVGEVPESVERLTARGFLERAGEDSVWIDPVAIRVIDRRDLPARFRMDWNAAKASAPVPGPLQCLSRRRPLCDGPHATSRGGYSAGPVRRAVLSHGRRFDAEERHSPGDDCSGRRKRGYCRGHDDASGGASGSRPGRRRGGSRTAGAEGPVVVRRPGTGARQAMSVWEFGRAARRDMRLRGRRGPDPRHAPAGQH